MKEEQGYQSYSFRTPPEKEIGWRRSIPSYNFSIFPFKILSFQLVMKNLKPTFWGSTFLLYQLGTAKCVCVYVCVC